MIVINDSKLKYELVDKEIFFRTGAHKQIVAHIWPPSWARIGRSLYRQAVKRLGYEDERQAVIRGK